jgi:hypothetical protein
MSSYDSVSETLGDTRVSSFLSRPSIPTRAGKGHSRRCSADHVITVETQPHTEQQTCHLLHSADEELQVPLLLPAAVTPEQAALRGRITFANGLSWVVNILLLVAKVWAYMVSGSKAVLASAADSGVDLLSQVVITYTGGWVGGWVGGWEGGWVGVRRR